MPKAYASRPSQAFTKNRLSDSPQLIMVEKTALMETHVDRRHKCRAIQTDDDERGRPDQHQVFSNSTKPMKPKWVIN
jgi:hypothetical protein